MPATNIPDDPAAEPVGHDAGDTRERILDAAEQQFAEHGIAETSLRSITGAASVNLAAVHYHFGSKDGLVQAVYARRLAPINRERLRLLDACEAAAGQGPPDLEGIVTAMVAPVLRLRQHPRQGGEHFMCLMSRIFTETHEALQPMMEQFEEVRRRFPQALRRALPHLDEVEVNWRMHFFIGAMMHTVGASHIIEHGSGGVCDPSDVNGTLRRLVAFVSAGLRAPVTPAQDAAETGQGVAS